MIKQDLLNISTEKFLVQGVYIYKVQYKCYICGVITSTEFRKDAAKALHCGYCGASMLFADYCKIVDTPDPPVTPTGAVSNTDAKLSPIEEKFNNLEALLRSQIDISDTHSTDIGVLQRLMSREKQNTKICVEEITVEKIKSVESTIKELATQMVDIRAYISGNMSDIRKLQIDAGKADLNNNDCKASIRDFQNQIYATTSRLDKMTNGLAALVDNVKPFLVK